MNYEIIFPNNHKTQHFLITAYLDDVRVGYGTILDYHCVAHLVSLANEWFGENNWNRLALSLDEEAAE